MFCERYWHKTVSTTISVNFISASPRFLIDHVIFPCSLSMQQSTNVIVLGFCVDNKWEKVISKCYWIFFELRTTLEIERHVNIDRSFFCYHVSRRISFETFQVVAFFPPRFHWLQGIICFTLNVQSASLQFTGYLLKYDIYTCSDLLIVGLTCMFMKTWFLSGFRPSFVLCVYITHTLVSYVVWKIEIGHSEWVWRSAHSAEW